MCWSCWAAFASQTPTFVEHSKPKRPQHPHAGAVSSIRTQKIPARKGLASPMQREVLGVNHACAA
jgi:hypothetical protein